MKGASYPDKSGEEQSCQNAAIDPGPSQNVDGDKDEAEEGAIVVAINDTQVEHGASIQSGDVISMFSPLAGG